MKPSLCLVLILFISVASAQSSGEIRLTVVDAVTKQPIGKAKVSVYLGALRQPLPPSDQRATVPKTPKPGVTDPSGVYASSDVWPGTYNVAISHPNYTPQGGTVNADISVKEGEVSRVTIELTPLASITGRIVDDDGDPIPGCIASLRDREKPSRHVPILGSTPSNEDGQYRIWGVVSGKWVVVATCARPILEPRRLSPGPDPPPTVGWLPQVYPGGSDLSTGQAIELLPATEKTGVDFKMRTARVYAASGKLSSADWDWRSRGDVNFYVTPRNPLAGRPNYRLNYQAGTWEASNLLPGSYSVAIATMNDSLGPAAGTYHEFTIIDKNVSADLQLKPPINFRPKIVFEGETKTSSTQVPLHVYPVQSSFPGPPPRVEPKQDGTVEVVRMFPGRYKFATPPGPPGFIKKVLLDGRELPDGVLEVTSGTIGSVELVFSTRLGRIRVKGSPGKPVHLIHYHEDTMTGSSSTATNASGNAEFGSLAPGQYRITSKQPQLGEPSEADSKLVTVGEGETLEVTLP